MTADTRLSAAPSELSAERREALLADARRIASYLQDPRSAGQAAVALVILRQRGLDGLRAALELDLPAGASAEQWRDFRRVMRAYAAKGGYRGPEELAFLLGWLRRLARLPVPRARR